MSNILVSQSINTPLKYILSWYRALLRQRHACKTGDSHAGVDLHIPEGRKLRIADSDVLVPTLCSLPLLTTPFS